MEVQALWRRRGFWGRLLVFGLCLSLVSGCALFDALGGDEDVEQEDIGIDTGVDADDVGIDSGDIEDGNDVGEEDRFSMCGGDGNNKKALDVSVGHRHACALMGDCTVSCWGNNRSGQLGSLERGCHLNGGKTRYVIDDFNECYSDSAVQVPGLDRVKSVSAGEEHTCAVYLEEDSEQGKVKCWGNGGKGRLDGKVRDTLGSDVAFYHVDNLREDSVVSVSAGRFHTCAVVDAVDESRGVKCWGDNSMLQLGGPGSFEFVSTQVGSEFVRLSPDEMAHSKHDHICVLDRGDDASVVWCWGLNSSNQVGISFIVDSEGNSNQSVFGNTLFNRLDDGDEFLLSTGFTSTCFSVRGTSDLYCWGSNRALDQIGEYINDREGGRELRSEIDWSYHFKDKSIDDVAIGDGFVCALFGEREVRCWGYNQDCRVDTSGSKAHTDVTYSNVFSGKKVDSIDAGVSFACAVSDGNVWCWGAQSFSSLDLKSSIEMCNHADVLKMVF